MDTRTPQDIDPKATSLSIAAMYLGMALGQAKKADSLLLRQKIEDAQQQIAAELSRTSGGRWG